MTYTDKDGIQPSAIEYRYWDTTGGTQFEVTVDGVWKASFRNEADALSYVNELRTSDNTGVRDIDKNPAATDHIRSAIDLLLEGCTDNIVVVDHLDCALDLITIAHHLLRKL